MLMRFCDNPSQAGAPPRQDPPRELMGQMGLRGGERGRHRWQHGHVTQSETHTAETGFPADFFRSPVFPSCNLSSPCRQPGE